MAALSRVEGATLRLSPRIGHPSHEQRLHRVLVADYEHEWPVCAEYRRRGGKATRARQDGGRRGGLGPLFVNRYEGLVEDTRDVEFTAPIHSREVRPRPREC